MYNSYYQLKLTGKNLNRFIKKLYKNNINIYKITFIDKDAYIKINKNDYEKVLNIKTIYDVEIIKTYGFIKLIEVLNKYKIFIICILINFIILLFLSNTIFDIEILHSKKEMRDLVLNELRHYDIKKYKLMKSYKEKEDIKNKILKENKDKIEWIEIERKGVKYVVRVEERIINDTKKNSKPTNIIASKDGIIIRIDAKDGEIVKKKGDYVKKGEVIISGDIKKGDEIKASIKANGSVYAETWYKLTIELPYYYNESIVTSKHHKRLKLSILNSNIYFYNLNKYQTYKENILFSITNKLLPIELKFVDEYKTKEINKIYTKEEINIESIKIGEKKLLGILSNDEYIISSRVLKSTDHSNYVKVEVFYKVCENIAQEEEIKIDNIPKNDKI